MTLGLFRHLDGLLAGRGSVVIKTVVEGGQVALTQSSPC